ncbi:MAG: hypothetical protein H6940_09610 [Burkholderiales bacterium]|uniref:hypothetical protein n=1 Tax=Nitrosomonas sp. TaxID=42353 RepID=UPI001D750A23|nr:hypothetical protein [Nitrosomonas sp.]MCB1947896.1 hypothetical protein [Nitrosomonas sp.]MCP5243669.1 hypothetical protein [Burkholderiales bacterium]
MNERIVSVEINLEEGNLILTALAECPFKTVFELIGKLNQQAQHQFTETVGQLTQKPFSFTEQEMALTIKALGKLPYEQVHQLLAKLNMQMEHQLRICKDGSGTIAQTYADR